MTSIKIERNKIVDFFGRMKEYIKHILNQLDFNSTMIEDYYKEISLFHTKRNLKNCMRLLLLFSYGSLFLNSLFVKGNMYTAVLLTAAIGILLAFYFSTIFIHSNSAIEYLAWLIMLLQNSVSILNINFMIGLLEINFTPVIQFTVLMFTNLPIKLNNAIVLSLISLMFVILAASTKFQCNILEHSKDIDEEASSLNNILKMIPLFDSNLNTLKYLIVLVLLAVSLILLSLYLNFINNFRRRSSFIKYGRNIQVNKKLKDIRKIQMKWTDAIMPHCVKEEFWEHNEDINVDKWIYIKSFEDVTILFANIIDFTEFSSKKSAPQVVAVLKRLFTDFDKMCGLTNCERIGTLGDLYYCVSGCPIPQTDHAACCIQMGLEICRIVREFNINNKEDIRIKIGIHTGRVNAGILGEERFRFDVYSNDVNIATLMEVTCKPNRIHISQTVYDSACKASDVENGENLEIKHQEDHGIGKSLLKPSIMKTYYVKQNSKSFERAKTLFYNYSRTLVRSVTSSSTIQYSDMDDEVGDSEGSGDNFRKLYNDHISEDLEFIEGIKYFCSKQKNPFINLPISTMSMMFTDKEIQWHYFTEPKLNLNDTAFGSMKFIPLIDALICSIYSIVVYISIIILFPDLSWIKIFIILLNIVFSITMFLSILWSSYVDNEDIHDPFTNFIYSYFNSNTSRYFNCFFFESCPLITIFCLLFDCRKINADYIYTIHYFTVTFFSTLIIPVYVSAPYFFRFIICALNFSMALYSVTISPCIVQKLSHTYKHYSCLGQLNLTDVKFYEIIQYQSGFQIVMTFLLAMLIIREMERNIKLWFNVSREAAIKHEEIIRVMHNSEKMLFNIIPKYVFAHLKIHISNRIKIGDFNYAMRIQSSGVIFVNVSNLFSSHYQGDYKEEEKALNLLHALFCHFDRLLYKEEYKDIEKVKHINDCYVVASGLNITEIRNSASKTEHLKQLMYYALELLSSLDSFNKRNAIGPNKFKLKIGYTFGPITAGIIGTNKPIYDIWGNILNFSRQMYLTSKEGHIQVPHYVRETLQDDFTFQYYQSILVDGKKTVDTYFCTGSRQLQESHTSVLSNSTATIRKSNQNVSRLIESLFLRKATQSWSLSDMLISLKGSKYESEEPDKYAYRKAGASKITKKKESKFIPKKSFKYLERKATRRRSTFTMISNDN